MKSVAKLAGVITGLAILLCLAPGLFADTHLGVKPSKIVPLQAEAAGGVSPTKDWVFKRTLPDLTMEADEFVVPDKQVLIVTDIFYLYGEDFSTLSIFPKKGDKTGVAYTIYGSQPFPIRDHLTAGIVVPSGGVLKIGVDQPCDLVLKAIGYLTPAR